MLNYNIHKQNLDVLISVKENDSLLLKNNSIDIDTRMMRNIRYTESINNIALLIKVSFYHYLILITLPNINFVDSTDSIILNDYSNNEYRINILNYLDMALDGLIRLIVYYESYKIIDYESLISLSVLIKNKIYKIREEYGLNNSSKINYQELEDKIDRYKIPEISDNAIFSDSDSYTASDNDIDNDSVSGSDSGSEINSVSGSEINSVSDSNNITYDNIPPSDVKLSFGTIKTTINNNNEKDNIIYINENVIDEQPTFSSDITEIHKRCKLTNEYEFKEIGNLNDEYFNPNMIRDRMTECPKWEKDNYNNDKNKDGYFTIPVFCSLHSAWKSVKNSVLSACGYIRNCCVSGAQKVRSWFY